ncbi:DNA cytosine methyltransferase [Lachnospiraceae bacterium 54-53]
MIKLYMGGSPCTHWSIAQTKNRETEPSGLGWELFENYVIGSKKYKPDYFLYENNKSMSPAIREQITKELGVEPILINSALVSAQSRQRLYWTNIPGVTLPEDKGIMLKDILETGESWLDKSYTLDASYYKATDGTLLSKKQSGKRMMVAEPIRIGTIESGERSKASDSQANRVYSSYGKSVTLLGQGGGAGAKTGLYAVQLGETLAEEYYQGGFNNGLIGMIENTSQCRNGKQPSQQYRIYSCYDKSVCVDTDQRKHYIIPADGKTYPIYEVRNGHITIKDELYPINLPDGYYIIRKLTVKECMRLQTVPDTYIFSVSNTQAYKMLGNGWTVDVIAHILSFVPGITENEVNVMSMYDGMSCGHIALDKLGVNVEKYYATEIDKYAIQTARENYPGMIHLGDAYQVRDADWENKYI